MSDLPKKPLTDDETGDEGQTGASGKIEFREFIHAGGPSRDDLLSGLEKKRLLIVHQQLHEALVVKQKMTHEKRQQLREGKLSAKEYQQAMGANNQYGYHPILSQAAQFSGMDNRVNAVPTENLAETNREKGEELQYRYNLAYQPGPRAKKEAPKPSPYR